MSDELPLGWAEVALLEIAVLNMGQSPPSVTYNTKGRGLPFFLGKAEFGDLYPTPEKFCSAPKKVAEAGDILISVRAPVGPTNICRVLSCIGRGLAAIRPRGEIPTHYLLFYLRSLEAWLATQGKGSTFTAISKSDLEQLTVRVAPLAEQQEIVRWVEALFALADQIEARFAQARALVAKLTPSLLARAFRGQLVPQDPTDEPAENLLERIHAQPESKSPGDARKWPSDSPLGCGAKTERVPSGTAKILLSFHEVLPPLRGLFVFAFATHR